MVFLRLNSVLLRAVLSAAIMLVACTYVGGCGSSAPALVARPPPAASTVERLLAGTTVAVTRPTPGVAQLSLWLDVGTRDVRTPQVVTAAAWWVAQKNRLEVRVLPDAIEFSTVCDLRSEALGPCVKRLAAALMSAAPSEAEAAGLRGRLREARLRALAMDQRVIERQALEALFGANGSALAPFGDEVGDPQVTAKNLGSFIHQHVHAGRALFVAVGSVDSQAIEAAWRATAPRRGAVNKTPRTALAPKSGLAVEEGPYAQFSFALSVPGNELAAAMARDFIRIYDFSQARVVRLRGQVVLMVTMPAGREPWKRLQRATFDLRRLAIEADPRSAPARGESIGELSSEIGEEWTARGQPVLDFPAPWPLGIAVHLREAAHAVPSEQASAAKRQEWLQLARAAIERGEAAARGDSEGSFSPARADVRTANGVRIRVERRAGARFMSAFVRFAGGSREDPAEHGGRAALLATALANGCGFSGGAALDSRLLALDARLTPLVSPKAFGARVIAPGSRTNEVVDTLLRCALRPALDARSIEDARLRLLASLHANEASLYEAFAARALDADAPGTYGSWGTPRGVAAVSASELRRVHQAALVGSRLDVLVVADADPRVMAQFVARRVAQLARGEAPAQAAPHVAKPGVIGERTRVRSPRVVVSLAGASERSSKIAAITVAHALGEAFAKRVGRLAWVDGGASGRENWAAVALELSEEELDTFAQRSTDVLAELRSKPEAFWRQRLAKASRDQLTSLSTAHGAADLLFHDAVQNPDDAALLDQVRALLGSPPGTAVLRPGH